jgi:EAL domain-containing protein (putative c-di-GMP-specific phosphodiesterase class I)
MSERGTAAADGIWHLEGYDSEGRELLRAAVRPLPFRIGRRPELGLTLAAASVSQEHAEIFADGGALWVRDLASTNGTFHNRCRLAAPEPLADGDILHFADQEFRLVASLQPAEEANLGTLQLKRVELPRRLLGSAREIRNLLEQGALTVLAQPIIDLAGGAVAGYELLGRGALEGLPDNPAELLALAASVGLEQELSRAFRRAAVAAGRRLEPGTAVFVNTHPGELEEGKTLLDSLRAIAPTADGPRVVLEVHEAAVAAPRRMKTLRQALAKLGIGIAYDDFGAGQARLLELMEVPPDYLKFDLALLRDLDRAGEGRRRSLATLVRMARELGITSVAEGIERAGEAEAARRVGFDLAQGYYFGRPRPL